MDIGLGAGKSFASPPVNGFVPMKTLVVKLGALGDVLRVTPVVHTLAENGHDIDMVTSFAGVGLFSNNPFVKTVYAVQFKRNPIELFFLKKILRKNRYGWVINFESLKLIRSFCNGLSAHDYVGPEKVTSTDENVNDFFYQFIKPVIKPGFVMYANEIYPSEQDVKYVGAVLKKFDDSKKIGIHVGTSKTSRLLNKNLFDVRLWPQKNYIELIRLLVQQNYSVFLTGSKLEKTINESIVREIDHQNVIDTAGLFTVQQLYAFIKQMDFFVSGDTGPAHIAAATPVRQICLCGPTNGRSSAPKKESNYVLLQKNTVDCPPCYAADKERKNKCRDNQCMKNIRVQDVFNILYPPPSPPKRSPERA